MTDVNEVLDIAIVGGGVSGVYAGYRLLGADLKTSEKLRGWAGARGGKLSVTVFESSHRIGGRLLSARPPGAPHMVCELGGMRYMSSQVLVKSLVENQLRCPTKPQVVDRPENLAYLRGSRLRTRDLKDSGLLPYALAWNERGKDPNDLLGYAIQQIFPSTAGLSGQALREVLNEVELDGKHLYEHGFWNVVARALSREAYSLSTTTLGYDSLGANGNAVDQTFEYLDFTPGATYSLFQEGYETVPWMLRDGFVASGGSVVMGATLRSFDAQELPDGTDGVVLHFTDGRAPVYARAIVLAMPQRSLRLLDPVGPVLDPAHDTLDDNVQSLIDSVFPVPLFKMFLAYPFPFWESVGVTEGRSRTDLMVRQAYYWGVEGRQPGADPKNSNALLMAYDDMSNVLFWGGLRKLPLRNSAGPHLALTRMFGGSKLMANARAISPEDTNWRNSVAPEVMVEEMHRQLVEIHGVRYAPDPYAAAYKDWSDDPFGGGVHFWNIGYRSTETMKRMTQPRGDFPCYVMGEAYSQGQTWVEGALQTAELVLQDRFGLAPPPWVKGV